MMGEEEEFGIIAEEEEVMAVKKRYGKLLAVPPDIVLTISSGHFAQSFSNAGRRLHDFTHLLRIVGRVSRGRIEEPKISRLVYEVRVRKMTIRALTTSLEFTHEHSFGRLSLGLQRGKAVADMIAEELRRVTSISPGIRGERFVIGGSSLGGSSLGAAYQVGQSLKSEMPDACFLDITQISSLPGSPREEVNERINLAHHMISRRVTKNVKALVIYPYLTSVKEGMVKQKEVFDACLHEIFDFFVDLAAYYTAFVIKLGREDLLEGLDAELDKTFAERNIFLLSSVHYAPALLDEVKWLAPPDVIKQFIEEKEIEKQGYLFGVFATRTMVESVKKALGYDTIPATGMISPRGESRWILCLKVEEKEVKELLASCVIEGSSLGS
jgi:hypothetical protein